MARKPTYEELEQRVQELEKEGVAGKRSEQRIQQLNLLKEQLLGPGTLKEKLKRITDGVVGVFDADFCRIWITKPGDLCDSECFHAMVTEGPHVCRYRKRCLHLMASSGRYTRVDGRHGRVPFGCYKIGRVASGQEPKFVTNDVTHDPRIHDLDWARRLGLVSFAGYRLLSAEGTPIGVLALFCKYPISPDEDALLEGLANTTAQVIQTAMMEEVLRESEERYRTIFELAADSIVLIDGETGDLLEFNKMAHENLGFTVDEFRKLKIPDFEIIEDTEEVAKHIKKIIKEGVDTFETKHRTKTGEIRDIQVSSRGISIRGKDFVQSIWRDITEHKRAVEGLQQSEREMSIRNRIAQIFVTVPDEEMYGEVLQVILEAFESKYGIFGYIDENGVLVIPSMTADIWEQCQVLDKTMVYPPDTWRGIWGRSLIEKRGLYANEGLRVPEGHIPIMRVLVVPVVYRGEVIGLIEVANKATDYDDKDRDFLETITGHIAPILNARLQRDRQEKKRKRAEEEVEDSKRRLDSIIRAVPDIIYRLDPNGNIGFISDAVKKYAYSPEALLKTNILELVHPDDRKGATYRINERRTKERATQLFEVRLFPETPVDALSEGKSEYRENDLVFLVTAEGLYESVVPRTLTFMGTQGIARDVTERRRLEAQLRQTAKMEAVGTLAGGIAHDFNNLLMGIQGNVSLMKMDTNPRHPYYQRLTKIEKQIESGARLTSHLLGYARKGKYQVKPIDLNNLLKENAEAFGRTRKKITIRQELDDDLFMIEADPGQIQQVLFNLFINASDAMPMGGELILKTMNATQDFIKKKFYNPKPGNYVVLTVTDTGIGMDKETIKHVFEPFFTSKGMGHGTGLGLASAYGIIKSHGGYIEAESKKGHGATFSVYLPASERPVRKTAEPVEQITGGTGTVLLVDDEAEILYVTKELLEAMGYEVITATNGIEAVEVYGKNHEDIDIVVMDLVMPNMGGGEAYDRIKEINPDVKVLLSSGFSIDGEAKAILKRGCKGFIQKPFRMDELSGKIREILDKK
jgi:PAS domain S-box-containing protein